MVKNKDLAREDEFKSVAATRVAARGKTLEESRCFVVENPVGADSIGERSSLLDLAVKITENFIG